MVVCVTGLLVSWGFAAMLGDGPGLSAEQMKTEENLVAIGYAVTYPRRCSRCSWSSASATTSRRSASRSCSTTDPSRST
ncbi:hypothetical protein DEJ45_23225 [Streptomyces venezuelae]|nr:hypothetical protein DEJ45_23225 [Streptomyces venezuelae]